MFQRTPTLPVIFFTALCLLTACAFAQSKNSSPLEGTTPRSSLVPQTILPLIHSKEVQSELGIESPLTESMRVTLTEIDAQWWPSRISGEAQRRDLVARLEKQLLDALAKEIGPQKIARLKEIELQAQGARALVRDDIVRLLKLTQNQVDQLKQVFEQTDKAVREKTEAPSPSNDATTALKILSKPQQAQFASYLGKPLKTSTIERIYPLAPELIDSGEWTGKEKLPLNGLRGKVVLIHFYAFQCHNCVANFEHYKRWASSLKEKGVVVIGIQTPETSSERDPSKVRSAATKEGFNFPVLIDLKETNWKAWGNTMWPTVYVVDKQGYIRHWWQGELNWDGATGDKTIESVVEKLLDE